MHWKCGSSSIVPALQAGSPESHQKKQNKTKLKFISPETYN
jgi:hypothetical protein